MTTEAAKPGLLTLLKLVGVELTAVLDAAGEVERTQEGTFERWSFKDTVAHVAYWQQWEADHLTYAQRGEPLPHSKDVDNAVVHAQYQHTPWDVVHAFAHKTYRNLLVAVEATTEAQFSISIEDPKHKQWLWEATLANGVWHPYDHMTGFYRSHGLISHAVQLHQRAYDAIRAVPAPGKMRGGPVYNMACVYALSGEPVKALNAFHEALRHDPWLLHWSKEDGDMRFLRMLPGYDALLKQYNHTQQEATKESQ